MCFGELDSDIVDSEACSESALCLSASKHWQCRPPGCGRACCCRCGRRQCCWWLFAAAAVLAVAVAVAVGLMWTSLLAVFVLSELFFPSSEPP